MSSGALWISRHGWCYEWGVRAGVCGCVPLIWRVAAVVVQEDGNLVVDDVIYLKDQNREADVRLSAYLSLGCDGTRWVGYSEQRGDHKKQR